ncbi:AAA-like domain-containing protein [Anaerolineales bacterium HSG25]|nr:AAA-like domain-containing protein [Anaerolineales bacterium HSG25]
MKEFVVGGTVEPTHPTYIKRDADDVLFKACVIGEYSHILTARQLGKSSLMVATAKQLKEKEDRETVIVDLTKISRGKVQANDWFFYLTADLSRRLKLTGDIKGWWDEHKNLSVIQRFEYFFRDIVLTQISKSIVIFLDEIDQMLEFDFKDDFFAVIRSMYNDRASYSDYKRLTFVLLGVATPDDLIEADYRTPFNIGGRISLRDFKLEDCIPFQKRLQEKYPTHGLTYLKQIHQWTNGHPYLTQKLSQLVYDAELGETGNVVENQIQTFFNQDRDDFNIDYIKTRVTTDKHAKEILRIYQQIYEQTNFPDDSKSIPIRRLKLHGLVVAKDKNLDVRNRIYIKTFDLDWVSESLEQFDDVVRERLDETRKQVRDLKKQQEDLQLIFSKLGVLYRWNVAIMIVLLGLIVFGTMIAPYYLPWSLVILGLLLAVCWGALIGMVIWFITEYNRAPQLSDDYNNSGAIQPENNQ